MSFYPGARTGRIYATWNPSNIGSNGSLSNGNLDATSIASSTWNNSLIRATVGKDTGKWYWEYRLTVVASDVAFGLGIADGTTAANSVTNILGTYANSLGLQSGASLYNTGVTRDYATAMPTLAVNDVFGWTLDKTNGRLYLHRNGTYFNSGDPVAGTGYVASGISGTFYPAVALFNSGNVVRANFGASAFAYSVPSGYSPGLF